MKACASCHTPIYDQRNTLMIACVPRNKFEGHWDRRSFRYRQRAPLLSMFCTRASCTGLHDSINVDVIHQWGRCVSLRRCTRGTECSISPSAGPVLIHSVVSLPCDSFCAMTGVLVGQRHKRRGQGTGWAFLVAHGRMCGRPYSYSTMSRECASVGRASVGRKDDPYCRQSLGVFYPWLTTQELR